MSNFKEEFSTNGDGMKKDLPPLSTNLEEVIVDLQHRIISARDKYLLLKRLHSTQIEEIIRSIASIKGRLNALERDVDTSRTPPLERKYEESLEKKKPTAEEAPPPSSLSSPATPVKPPTPLTSISPTDDPSLFKKEMITHVLRVCPSVNLTLSALVRAINTKRYLRGLGMGLLKELKLLEEDGLIIKVDRFHYCLTERKTDSPRPYDKEVVVDLLRTLFSNGCSYLSGAELEGYFNITSHNAHTIDLLNALLHEGKILKLSAKTGACFTHRTVFRLA